MASDADEITKKICVACNTEYTQGETTCPHDGTALTPLAQNKMIGSVLGGRYEIEEKIGAGAMGEVYKAKHRLMKRQVAIKVLHPQTISGANALKRFQKEAEMASALNHPNILAVHDFGVADDGSPYLVMNFLEGKNLNDLIANNGHLDVVRAIYIFRQICLGLGHAHEKGVIHRDLKPSNIMLVELDQDPDFVQILDFGIAKQLSENESSDSLTRTGEVFGSPHYMSPEQCRAQPVDARSDVYALGCVMYRVLTGYPPIMGGDLVECLYKHVNQMPEPFKEMCPELQLPEDLEAVVFKAVAKKPEDRYQTMAELKAALESTEVYKVDIATKTYGSLSGLKASATLTSLPASATISHGGQIGDPSTATAAAATAVGFNAVSAEAGPIAKPKASDTGDMPAMQGTEISANESSGAHNIGSAGTASGAAGGPPSSAPVAQPAHPVEAFGHLTKPKIIAAAAAGVLVLGGIVYAVIPKGDAKIEKLQKEAKAFYEQGQFSQADAKIREAINEAKKLGEPDSDASFYLLGEIQYAEGDFSNAQSSLESALKLRTAKNGPTSKEVADVQSLLGTALTAQGNYKKAEQVLQQSYQTRKQLNGDNSAAAADSLAGLGYLHVREHAYSKAIAELTNALRIVQSVTSQDSPEASAAMCNLGEAYQWSGNFPQAEALYKQALGIRRKKLDPNNATIADVLKRLASVYLAEGQLMQARDYYEQALKIQEKNLDAASPQLAQTRQDLASVSSRLGIRRHR